MDSPKKVNFFFFFGEGPQAKLQMNLTPMLRMTHKETAINNPTPLLLNARDSSKIMPAYPNANTSTIAISCATRYSANLKSL